jgi:hypothetical protein
MERQNYDCSRAVLIIESEVAVDDRALILNRSMDSVSEYAGVRSARAFPLPCFIQPRVPASASLPSPTFVAHCDACSMHSSLPFMAAGIINWEI